MRWASRYFKALTISLETNIETSSALKRMLEKYVKYGRLSTFLLHFNFSTPEDRTFQQLCGI